MQVLHNVRDCDQPLQSIEYPLMMTLGTTEKLHDTFHEEKIKGDVYCDTSYRAINLGPKHWTVITFWNGTQTGMKSHSNRSWKVTISCQIFHQNCLKHVQIFKYFMSALLWIPINENICWNVIKSSSTYNYVKWQGSSMHTYEKISFKITRLFFTFTLNGRVRTG